MVNKAMVHWLLYSMAIDKRCSWERSLDVLLTQ